MGCDGSGCASNELAVWDGAHSGQLLHLVGLPGDGSFVSCGGDGMMRIWDDDFDNPANTIETKPPGRNSVLRMDVRFDVSEEGAKNKLIVKRMASARVSSGAVLAAAGDDGVVRVWDLDENREGVRKIKALDSQLNDTAIEPGGRFAFFAGAGGEVAVVDLLKSEPVAYIEDGATVETAVYSLSVSPDGKWLVTGDALGRASLFDVSNLIHGEWPELKLTIAAHDAQIRALDFSVDSRYLVTAGQDGKVNVVRADSGDEIWSYPGQTYTSNGVMDVSVANILAVALLGGDVKIISLENGATIKDLKAHTVGAMVVAFSPDGKVLASGGKDHEIIIWNAETWERIKVLKGHTHWLSDLVFSPDGKYLASGSILDKMVFVWDAGSWAPRCEAELTDRPTSIGFNAEGDMIAVGSRDGKVWLWRPESCAFMTIMQGHAGSVEAAAYFKADGGANLVTADNHKERGRVFIWPFPEEVLHGDAEGLYQHAQKDTGLSVEGMDLAPMGSAQ